MVDSPDENSAGDRAGRPPQPGAEIADEVERSRTPRTPLLALAGVWLTVAITFVLVLAVVALTLYLL